MFFFFFSELLCPMMQPKDKLQINCSPFLSYGGNCSFACLSGYPQVGPSVVYCERNETVAPPFAFWDWGMGQNETYCTGKKAFACCFVQIQNTYILF